MNEVISRLDPAHRRAQGLELEDVARDDRRRVAVSGDGLRAAGQAAHLLPLLEHSEEPAADVAGGAGEQDLRTLRLEHDPPR